MDNTLRQRGMVWLLVVVFACGVAAPGAQAQQRTKAPTYIELDITLHRGNCNTPPIDVDTAALTFKTGEVFVVCYTASATGYIYFISESAAGTLIAYPTRQAQIKPMREGEQRAFAFRLTGDTGPETLTALVSPTPIEQLDELIGEGTTALSRKPLFGTPGSSGPAVKSPTARGFKRWFKPIGRALLGAFFGYLSDHFRTSPAKGLVVKSPTFDETLSDHLNVTPGDGGLPPDAVMSFQIVYEHVKPGR